MLEDLLEMRMSDLANIVLLRAHAGKSASLGEALNELVTRTQREPGNAICELNQSAADSNVWMVYERWKGQDAFDSHMQQLYVVKFLGLLDDLVSEPPEVRPFNYRG
jgi:quinol monooxygenase YgiN